MDFQDLEFNYICMLNWEETFNLWKDNVSSKYKKELDNLSESEKKELFSKEISFGTAGIRDKIGCAPSLINEYVISRYALNFSKFLLKEYGEEAKKNGIIIAHDNRKMHDLFSNTFAEIISAQGIPVFFFPKNKLNPTPLLSYTIANNNFIGGINITASHNPPNYNGVKFYNKLGAQLSFKEIDLFKSILDKDDSYFNIQRDKKNINFLSNQFEDEYVKNILLNIPFDHNNDFSNLKIVFTPQHGTAMPIAKKIFKSLKIENYIVKEQSFPDENFKNTVTPNPQNEDAFILSRKYGDKYNADVLFSTDPDADRFGIEIKHNNEWVHINGNELPLIQLFFKLNKLNEINYFKDNKKTFVVRSIVTSHAADKLAKKYNVEVFESLTGFKWIADRFLEIEKKGYECLFAWEESYGSIVRTFTRDKDSFQALIQISEIISFYKRQNKTLVDVLEDIYKEINYFKSGIITLNLEKYKNGSEKIDSIMNHFRSIKLNSKILDYKITQIKDFLKTQKDFVKDNVIVLEIDKLSKISIRPSGTEPILKIYIDIQHEKKNNCDNIYNVIYEYIINLLKDYDN